MGLSLTFKHSSSVLGNLFLFAITSQCKNVVWLPGSVSEAVVTTNVCSSCAPGCVIGIFLSCFVITILLFNWCLSCKISCSWLHSCMILLPISFWIYVILCFMICKQCLQDPFTRYSLNFVGWKYHQTTMLIIWVSLDLCSTKLPYFQSSYVFFPRCRTNTYIFCARVLNFRITV